MIMNKIIIKTNNLLINKLSKVPNGMKETKYKQV